MVLKNSKKGAQGIGTLIIFIAMILVAAVAAGVLIQTASSLQSKSLDVGRQSQDKITTDIDVVQVYAGGTNDNVITGGTDPMYMVVRLGSGSSPIKLGDLLLKFDTKGGTQTVTNVAGAASQTQYNVTYIISGTNHQTGYLVPGDLATVKFVVVAGTDVAEGETTTLRLVSKNGAVKPVQITTPGAMVEATTYLFP